MRSNRAHAPSIVQSARELGLSELSNIVEDHAPTSLHTRLALLIGVGLAAVAAPLTSPTIALLIGLAAGLVAYFGAKEYAKRQRKAATFNEGEVVRTLMTATGPFRPGEIGKVRGLQDDPNMRGKKLYLVEFRDGSTVAVPEMFLERVVSV